MSNDSIRTAFNHGQRATSVRLSLEKSMDSYPEYVLKQDDVPVAILRGKEMVCGGEHFAVLPFLPVGWALHGGYALSNANVPYWDGERRLRRLDVLLLSLSSGMCIPQALDDAVDAEDDEFFTGIPEVAYTGQQPEDFPLPVPIGWEPEPETPEPAGMTPDEWVASTQPEHITRLASIYPWTFWYRSGDGDRHQVTLEATYEDAQRVWDKLSTTLDLTSKRP